MKFGTILLHNKMYDLDNMNETELEALLKNINTDKTTEFDIAKRICKREEPLDTRYNIDDIPSYFKNFLDTSSIFVKNEAIIQRALIQKFSYDAIISKVNNKRNSIIASIKKINPKYNKSNKRFDEIQKNIDNNLKKYETLLYDLSDFYDNKIEQLILKKLELNANMVGSIIKDEYLIEEEGKRKDAKEKDKLLLSLSSGIKNYITKFTLKKQEKKVVDVTMISNLEDRAELEQEQKNRLNISYEKTKDMQKVNLENILNFENQIISIEKEIKRLNVNKVKAIMDAMESESKGIIIAKNNTNIIGRIKLFIKSRFNPTNVIFENVINPMSECMNDFEKNVLENIKD